MEWYRILIVIIGAVGMIAAIANWYFNGVDVPNGLVTLLSIIITGTLGPDALDKLRDTFTKSQDKPSKEEDKKEGEE